MSDEFFRSRNNNLLNDYFADYKHNKSDIFISVANESEKEFRKNIISNHIDIENGNNHNETIQTVLIDDYIDTNNDNKVEYNDNLESAKNRKPRGKLALLLLLIAVLGSIFIVNNVKIDCIDAVNTNISENFEDLIKTLVMQDPSEFNNINEADIDTITKASIWECILSQEDNYYNNFDSRGFTIIPSEDIINTAKKLFGSSYLLELKNPSSNTFYELSEDKTKFFIKPISNHNNCFPMIEHTIYGEDSIILKVAYIPGNDPYRIRPEGEVERPTAEKYMYYTLKKDNETNKYYIYSVKEKN